MSSASANNSHIKNPSIQYWLVFVFMAATLFISWWFTPHVKWYEYIGQPEFVKIIPMQFGDWFAEDTNAGEIVDPQQKYAIENLYTQTVGRTYLHKPSGRRIMFSLAYGDNQTYSKQLHRPEACYSSQGFKIESLHQESLQLGAKAINVNRMSASIGSRTEQVTYFIRVGDKVISGPALELNYARLQMGVKGYTSDGLLFRISEISDEPVQSYSIQDQFIRDLLQNLRPNQQANLIGTSL